MAKIRRTASRVAATLIVAAAGVGLTSGTSSAGPSGHQVTYTITSKVDEFTTIIFMANQPKNEVDYADHSANYMFVVRPKVNPDKPWSYTATLADPGRWAWLGAGDWYAFDQAYVPPDVEAIDLGYQCEIAIDGHVVASNHGSRQVACGTPPINHLVPDVQGTA